MKLKIYQGTPSKIIIIIFIIFLFLNQKVSSSKLTNIVINEVMYNPKINDNYNEWIELYNPTSQYINVSGWTLVDNFAEDFLEGDFDHGNGTTTIPPYGYAIITDHGTSVYENFSVANNTIRLYIDDSAIGNGLGNSKDKLIIKNNSGYAVDSIEWGGNYPDVPGLPAELIDEGHTLSRYPNIDTDNSSNDFYDGITPTPGSRNEFVKIPDLYIETYPTFIPKIQNNSDFSVPFAIKVKMSNYSSYEIYQLKAYVTGKSSDEAYATQTWNGITWKYSNYYTSVITTDEHGNWSDWVYLRFKRDYKEYQQNIENNNTGMLYVKIKKDNVTDKIYKDVFLLDMDETTSNGTVGGYSIGIAKVNNTFLQNKIILIENSTPAYAGAYVSEDNQIDDGLTSTPGYYKISSPVGSGYKIKFLDKNDSVIHTVSNVSIEQGVYGVDVQSEKDCYLVKIGETLNIPLTVKNIADFYDNIKLYVDIAQGWQATLERENVSLYPGEICNINLSVSPGRELSSKSTYITISATSEKDIGESDEITLQIEILAPDLTVRNIKIYDEYGKENNTFGEGEIARIKAFIKNIGNEDAKDVDVRFYYDRKDDEHFIGSKHYDSVSKYQKYPSVKWDTLGVLPGTHTVFVVVDKGNQIEELSELNNEMSSQINILDTSPSGAGKNALIAEIYYHTHPNINNEFIAICNPTSKILDISGWYITNQPLKTVEKQKKIIFPDNTTISPRESLYITQNASAYLWETGKKPDFEYNVDSDSKIQQMVAEKKFTLSNKGSMVALKALYNHTIDIVVYGESEYNCRGWNGTPIPSSGAGTILKRNTIRGIPIDTNTSNDWIHPRRYGIGQSDFPYVNIPFNGEIKTFVSPDCSFETIANELRKANKSIYFNIYEFTNPFLCDELVAALKRNVSVNIFLEGSPVGGIPDKEKFVLNRIANYGGNIRFIVNDKENDVYARYTFDHGKYLVIDNETVIVESCNWAKTGIPIDPTFGNREWGIVVRSEEIAEYFLDVFFDDWNPQRCDSYSFDELDLSISPDFYMDESIFKGSYVPEFEPLIIADNFSAIPVFSPDTGYDAICNMINSASESIYIEQLYIYKDWKDQISPFVKRLVDKSKQGVDIKVILNYNPYYEGTNVKCNLTKQYFEENGIEVKFVYTNWSIFTNIHNKGMIVDNESVLIASINWNENSVTRNREAGIIIENKEVARYYANVFFYDWNLSSPQPQKQQVENVVVEYKNTIYIVIIYILTFALIARDWRKRKWT